MENDNNHPSKEQLHHDVWDLVFKYVGDTDKAIESFREITKLIVSNYG